MVTLLGVQHGNDNLRAACAEVHGAAHTGNLLARYDPVGKVTVFGNFHCAKNGRFDVSASDETERFRGIKILYSWNSGYISAAGVDDVNVEVGSIRNCVDTCESVFGVERNGNILRNIVCDHGWQTDT